MSDNPKKRGAPDRRKINIHQPWELAWWSAAYGVSRAQLRKAVKAVGVEVKAVREYFFGKPKPKPRKKARKRPTKK